MNELLNVYYSGPLPIVAAIVLSVLGGMGAAYWTRKEEVDQSAPLVVVSMIFGVLAALVLPVIVMVAGVIIVSIAAFVFFRWVVT